MNRTEPTGASPQASERAQTAEARVKHLEGLLDDFWILCTEDYQTVVARFGDSRLKDDEARVNYMAELLADVAPLAKEESDDL